MSEQKKSANPNLKYRAFISYSHKDEKFGKWLHKALERYRVPKRLAAEDSYKGEIPRRIFPVFRDRDELPVSVDLNKNIEEALNQSEFLIVICSPNSAKSRWVNEEIRQFKAMGRENKILALIIDGEPNASQKAGFSADEECFPPALKFNVNEQGELTNRRVEPIAGDARKIGDGKKDAFLKIIAGLLGVSFGQLRQREIRRRRRRNFIISASTILLISVLLVLTITASQQRNRAIKAEREAIVQRDNVILGQSNLLTVQALYALRLDESHNALVYLAEAVRKSNHNYTAGTRLVTLLTQRSWQLPVNEPFRYKDLSEGIIQCDPRSIVRNGIVNQIITFNHDGSLLAVAPFGNTLFVWNIINGQINFEPMKHNGLIRSVRFNNNGNLLVTASSDSTAIIWNANSGEMLIEPLKHCGIVNYAEFSPDGEILATACSDNILRIWDTQNGNLIYSLEHEKDKSHSGVISCSFNNNGSKIISITKFGLYMWDLVKGGKIKGPLEPLYGYFHSAIFSPDNNSILTTSWDGTVGCANIFNLVIDSVSITSLCHEDEWEIYSASFNYNGKKIITSSMDRTAFIWDVETGNHIAGPMYHDDWVSSATFSPNGEFIITASLDGTACIWDEKTGKPNSEKMLHLNNYLIFAKYTPEGLKIATLAEDGTVRIWSSQLSKEYPVVFRHEGNVNSRVFCYKGKNILTASDDSTVRLWDTETGVMKCEPMIHEDFVEYAEFSPDGKYFLTLSSHKKIHIWNAIGKVKVYKELELEKYISFATFSPDGRYVLIISNNTVYIWEIEQKEKAIINLIFDHSLNFASFSPDGKLIVAVAKYDNTAYIRSIETGEIIENSLQHGGWITSAVFSKDGKYVLTSSEDKTVCLWDVDTGRLVTTNPLRHDVEVNSALFSPHDERYIITACGELGGSFTNNRGYAIIWDTKTGEKLTKPMRHGDRVVSAVFSPDGRYVVTASWDNTARIWDAETGQPLADPLRHEYCVNSAVFSPNGRYVVTASRDNTARIWDIGLGAVGTPTPPWVADMAEAVAGQRLTDFGMLEPLENQFQAIQAVKRKIERDNNPAHADWVRWATWFFADREKRTISPFSDITIPEYKKMHPEEFEDD